MADNKLVFTVENFGAEGTIKKLAELKLVHKDLVKQIAEANKADNKKLFDELSVSAERTRLEIKKTTTELRTQQGEVSKLSTAISNSLTGAFSSISAAGLAAGIAKLGFEAGKSIINIEKLYFQIKNITSSTDADIKLFKEQIPQISSLVGQSQEDLLKGLYQITSSGVNGQQAIDTLTVSAKLSAIGLGDTNTIARTLSGTINAYGKENLSAAKAAEVLFSTVKLGSGDVSEIASSFSSVTTLAAKFGVNLDQVGATIAAITNKGTKASEAITQLQSIFIALLKPTKEGEIQLAKVNLSYEKLRDLASIDLIKTLQLVSDKFKGNAEAMADVFGRSESLQGVFSLTGSNAKNTSEILKGFKKQLEEINPVFDQYNETNGQRIARFFTTIGNGAIDALGAIIKGGDNFIKGAKSAFSLESLKSAFGDGSFKFAGIEFGKKKSAPIDPNSFKNDQLEIDAQIANEQQKQDDKFAAKAKERRKKTKEELAAEAADAKRHNKELLNEHEKELKAQEKLDSDLEKIFEDIRRKREDELRKSRKAEEELLKPLPNLPGATGGTQRKTVEEVVGSIPKPKDKKDNISFFDSLFGTSETGQAFKEATNQTISEIGDFAISELQKENAEIEKNRDLRISTLNAEYDKKKAFAKGNADLLNKIEQERAAKEEIIRKESGKKAQALAIKIALVNAALAATNTLANVPPPFNFIALIPLAASLALQIAQIKSQKFAKGGMTGPGSSYRDETGKRVAGIVHENEYVAPDHQVQRHASLFNWLNQERKQPGIAPPQSIQALSNDRFKKYAEGGFTSPISRTGLNTGNTATNSIVTLSDQQVAHFAKQVALHVKAGTKEGIGEGLNDANRLAERKQRLSEKLQA
jgi:TP901 family phage tail tape measure protein